jgi:glycosyltransferase involved in cell wall biosynthesis
MWQERTVAVVVPARNEARLIGRMLARVPDYVDLIVVVDDASTDGTSMCALGSGDRRVRVERHPRNRGVGAAIVTGYQEALRSRADIVVVMAGDDQMDPADLPSLIAPVASGTADYVKGNRFLHRERKRMPLQRRMAGMALSAATRAATGLPIGDSQCGYTAIASEAVELLIREDVWPRYGYPNDFLGILAAKRMRVVDVPVRPVYADEESGVRPWHVLTVLGVVLRRYVLSRQANARATMASAHLSVWARSKHRSRSATLSRPETSASAPSS